MTIKILEERIIQDINIALDVVRHVDIIISNGTTHYHLGVGDLSLVGDLQVILDARETELWRVAQEKDNQLTIRQVRRLLYNSTLGGGWTGDEFQEAIFERDGGDETKWNILKDRRSAIRADWSTS